MKRLLLFLLLIHFFVLNVKEASGSHSMGSDLTYRCIGPNQYELTLSFYRDCIGIPADQFAFIFIRSSCYPTLSATLSLIPGTGQEITPLCPSQVSTCSGGSFTGVQEYIYRGIVNLPGPCADWEFSYNLCCRNAAITNLDFPSNSSIYVFATLNNLAAPCNNSPVFTNKPVPFVCLGETFCYNHGGFDPDGDSLVYELFTPLDGPNFTVQYSPGFSAFNPLSSNPAMTFNPATGDICITPTNMEVTVMAVLVKEYRNGVLIGSVERDIQVTVIACNNQLPAVSGINGTNNFSASVCAGNQLCFNLTSTDADAAQTTSISWDAAIPGASFTVNPGQRESATFCWTPQVSDISNTPYCFTVTVKDNNCPYLGSQTFSYCITVSGISVNAGSDISVGCNSSANLTATASGGSGSYNYNWNNGMSGAGISAGPGTYIVTVNDGQCTARDTVQVLAGNNTPTAGFSIQHSCAGLNVQFTNLSTINGGSITGYTWHFGDGNTSNALSPIHNYSSTGNYQVLLIAESGPCRDTLIQNFTLSNDIPDANFNSQNVCPGTPTAFNDQSTSISPITQYSWDFGDSNTSGLANPSHTYSAPGSYDVMLLVRNSAGCVDSVITTVVVFDYPQPLAGNDTTICEGESVLLNGSGGVQYTWNPGNLQSSSVQIFPVQSVTYILSVTDQNGCTGSDTVDITVSPNPALTPIPDQSICIGDTVLLNPQVTGAANYTWMPGGSSGQNLQIIPVSTGTFYFTATSTQGCESSDTVDVIVHALPVLSINSENVSCFGGNDGSADVQLISGASPYSFIWSPSVSSSQQASGLNAGNYSVRVIDNTGCEAVSGITITQPSELLLSTNSTPALCAGAANGAASVIASGGIGPYTYLWSHSGSTSGSITNLMAGNYSVTVRDSNLCTSISSVTVSEPPALQLIPAFSSLSCFGSNDGSASVQVSGGIPGYHYMWSPGGGNTSSISGLTPGTYTVQVSDSNACTDNTSVTITEPTALQSVTSSTPAACSTVGNGTASVSVSGGTGSYSYSWMPGGGNTSSISGLTPGIYTSIVTDANGCTTTSTANVGSIGGPQIIQVSVNPVSCFGNQDGSATITIQAGSPPYAVSWSPGGFSGMSIANLTAGMYQAIVNDANGCSASEQVQIPQPDPLQATVTGTDVSCFGTSNGSLIAQVTGGVQPFTYSWTNSPSQSNIANGLPAGSYTLTVRDNNLCTHTISATVSEPSELIPVISGVDLICHGDLSGSVSVSVSGGIPSYRYVWSPGGDTSSTLNNIPGGFYSVLITDAGGCTVTGNRNIQEPPPVLLMANPNAPICIGQSQTLHLNASGGTRPYTYTWSTGNSDSSITVSPQTSTAYSVYVTDSLGCQSAPVNIPVSVYPPLNLSVSDPVEICAEDSITISANVSGGNGGPYFYSWNNGLLTGQSHIVYPQYNTSYVVIARDGCGTPYVTDSIPVVVKPLPSPAFLPHSIRGCSPVTVQFENYSSGANYYQWNFGDLSYSSESEPSHVYTVPGVYDVTLRVTSTEGCSSHITIEKVVQVFAFPAAGFSQSAFETSILEPTVNFYDESHDASYWEWDFGDGSPVSFEANPVHEYKDSGTYIIRQVVMNQGGCVDTIYSMLRVEMEFVIHVPNAFTPNGDGVNDGFMAKGIGINAYNMWIINRWGRKIFHSDSKDIPWDGTVYNNGNQCQADVYEWVLEVLDFKNEKHKLVGHVTLVR